MAEFPSADQIFSGLHTALLIIDSDDRLVKVNPSSENLLGTSAKGLVGQRIGDVIQFDDVRLVEGLEDSGANLAARRVEVFTQGRTIGLVDIDIHPLPADPRWRLVSLSPLRQDGPQNDHDDVRTSQFAVRGPDILSHEIKNPLAAIKGAAQLLDRNIGDEQKQFTQMIKSEVERIVKLLDRMQRLSSNQPAKIESVNIHALIDRARASMETALDGKITIGDQFDPSLPNVDVDSDAMMQILTNLLSNAVEATRETDNPNIEIVTRYSFGASLSSHDSDASIRLPVEIIVRDNGSGVPPELEREIFSPFVSTKTNGQGLGLALVSKLIRDMNGRIRYERDTERERTQFILFLPVAERIAYGA